jgi:hypothetical protein
MRGLIGLLYTPVLLASLALAPNADAQISVTIGGPPPVCSYGYYGYAPYSCAPVGYYGSGYFYNGVFLGMGPWSGWGYNHGWGGHRFVSAGGGRYTGGYHGAAVVHTTNRGAAHTSSAHYSQPRAAEHNTGGHNNQGHAAAPHAAAPHAAAAHGGESHGGGGEHR